MPHMLTDIRHRNIESRTMRKPLWQSEMMAPVTMGARALFACTVLAAVVQTTPAFTQDMAERVVSLLSQAKYSEARQAVEPLLRRDPDAPRLRLIDGILKAREDRTAEAIAILERLRDERPEMFEPYNNLAVLYAREGRLDAARDALLAALERRSDATSYANLGDIYRRLAERAYAKARELAANPDDAPAPRRRSSMADRPGSPDAVVAHSPIAAVQATAARAPKSDRVERAPIPLVKEASVAPPRRKPSASVGQGTGCLRAGRFADRAAATEAAEWLRERGARLLDIRHEQGRVVKNHRVYLASVLAPEAAAAKLRELHDRGVRDAAVISKGPLANRISLGLYNSDKNARRRVAELRKLGYPAESAANTKAFSEYAVRAQTAASRASLEANWNAKFPRNPLLDCP